MSVLLKILMIHIVIEGVVIVIVLTSPSGRRSSYLYISSTPPCDPYHEPTFELDDTYNYITSGKIRDTDYKIKIGKNYTYTKLTFRIADTYNEISFKTGNGLTSNPLKKVKFSVGDAYHKKVSGTGCLGTMYSKMEFNLTNLEKDCGMATHINNTSLTGLKNLIIFMNCYITIPTYSLYFKFVSKTNDFTPVLLKDTFRGLCGLDYINLEKNGIKAIEPNAFSCVTDLKELILSDNEIESIQDHDFKDLTQLGLLDLSQNRIRMLPDKIFDSLANLRILYLQKNKIQTISNEIFKGIRFLDEINLSDNLGLILHPSSFLELVSLGELTIESCDLTSLPDLPPSQSLHFSRNRIQFISKEHFHKLIDLKFLDISSNEISEISSDSFKNNSELTVLNLSKNNLSRLETGYFRGLSRLKKLDLSENVINNVEDGVFHDMIQLSHLNISHNHLSFLDLYAFQASINLESIDVSYNRLFHIHIFERITQFPRLREIRMTDNQITQLLISTMPIHNTDCEIHLEGNIIKYIYVDQKKIMNERSSGRARIYLNGNPLRCDCNAYGLYQILNGSDHLPHIEFADDLTCRYPEKVRGRKLKGMNQDDFATCVDCPNNCTGADAFFDNNFERKINCSGSNRFRHQILILYPAYYIFYNIYTSYFCNKHSRLYL